jgi:ABC-type multidrug transport system ATPase subunit
MIAIETINLEKTYAVGFWRKTPRVALGPLNLTVAEGEVFVFLGTERFGKTTSAEAADGSGLSDRQNGADSGQSRKATRIVHPNLSTCWMI